MIYLLRAFDFWGVVREVLVDCEAELERAALVHAFVRFDCQGEIEYVVGVGELDFHG